VGPTTRCKFICDWVKNLSYGAEIQLRAVMPDTSDDFQHGEDHAFWTATPTGILNLTINNPRGAEIFQPGKAYYLDISEVPAATEA